MSKKGHCPQRTCLGCGAKDDQNALLRLVVRNHGELAIDPLAQGRGGYLHNAKACWQAFLRRRSLYRALHVEIGKDAKEKLVRQLRERHTE